MDFKEKIERLQVKISSCKTNIEMIFTKLKENEENQNKRKIKIRSFKTIRFKYLFLCENIYRKTAKILLAIERGRVPKVEASFIDNSISSLKKNMQRLHLKYLTVILFPNRITLSDIPIDIKPYNLQFQNLLEMFKFKFDLSHFSMEMLPILEKLHDDLIRIKRNALTIEYNLYHNLYNYDELVAILTCYVTLKEELKLVANVFYKKLYHVFANELRQYEEERESFGEIEIKNESMGNVLKLQSRIIREILVDTLQNMKTRDAHSFDYAQYLTYLEILKMNLREMMLYNNPTAEVEPFDYEPKLPINFQDKSIVIGYMFEELEFGAFTIKHSQSQIASVLEKLRPDLSSIQFYHSIKEKAKIYLQMYRNIFKSISVPFNDLKTLWRLKQLKAAILNNLLIIEQDLQGTIIKSKIITPSDEQNLVKDRVTKQIQMKPQNAVGYFKNDQNWSKQEPTRRKSLESSLVTHSNLALCFSENQKSCYHDTTNIKDLIFQIFKIPYEMASLGNDIKMVQLTDLRKILDLFGLDSSGKNVREGTFWETSNLFKKINQTVKLRANYRPSPGQTTPENVVSPTNQRVVKTYAGDHQKLSPGEPRNLFILEASPEFRSLKYMMEKYPLGYSPSEFEERIKKWNIEDITPKKHQILPAGEIIPLDIPSVLLLQPWKREFSANNTDEQVIDWSFVTEVATPEEKHTLGLDPREYMKDIVKKFDFDSSSVTESSDDFDEDSHSSFLDSPKRHGQEQMKTNIKRKQNKNIAFHTKRPKITFQRKT